MKKILLSLTILSGLSLNAQKVMKDFTLTDVNGNVQNLYSYLDQGKSVIIDISAAWCGPCWSFHTSGVLEELHANHGPAGAPGVSATTTDDLLVLFLEGETQNGPDQLNGINSNGQTTQGNWITGTQYPIIDLPSNTPIMSDLGLTAFPTLYKICPNRIVEEIQRNTAENLYGLTIGCPEAGTGQAIDAAYLNFTGKDRICGPVTYSPKVVFQNKGLDVLKAATISIKVAGVEVSTGSYSNSTGITSYSTATVTCSAIPNYMGGDLEVSIVTPNDTDVSNDAKIVNVIPAPEVSNIINFLVTTDGYPSETSWRFKNSTGGTVPGTSIAAGALTATNTDYSYTYFLPSAGCFSAVLNDVYGDGTGSIWVGDDLGNVIYDDAMLGGLKTIEIPFKVVNYLSIDEKNSATLNVYPNPTDGALTIKGENLTSYQTVELIDQLGRNLGSWNMNSTMMNIDLSNVESGNYMLLFKGATGSHTQQIQVNK